MPFQKGEHPRLFFSAAELPELRRRARSGLRAEMLSDLTAFCDRLLDPADELYFDFAERRKPFWRVRAGRWIIEPSLISLALAHAFTGERRYGEAARDAVMTIITERLADDPHDMAGYGRTAGWRHGGGHDKAMYAWAICHVFDMCHDLFRDEQQRLFIDHVRENIAIAREREVYLSDHRNWPNNRGSRAAICCFGMYYLLLEGEADLSPELLEEAVHVAGVYLHTAFDQDGVNYEGPSYGGPWVVAEFAWMLRRSGRADLMRNRRFDRYLRWMLYDLLPGDAADVNLLNDASPDAASVAAAVLLPDGPRKALLPWLIRRLDLHPKRLALYRAAAPPILPYSHFIHYILLNWDDAAPVLTPQELGYPPSHFFPQRGIADMRTGWEHDDVLLAHFCGFQMVTEHKQSDFNHVALYALGEQFLVDEGYGQEGITEETGYGERNYRYFGRADVHNTVIYDGRDQNGNQAAGRWTRWAEGRIIDWRSTPEFDTSLGDAAGAYGPDCTIDKALRRVVFVRRAAHPFAIVIDAMRVDRGEVEHDFEALWRTARGNRIEVDGRRFRIVGREHDCLGEVLTPHDVETRVITHYNLPQLRVKHRAAALAMVTVLVPLRRGEEPPRFACRCLSDDEFEITAEEAGVRHIVRAGTRREGSFEAPAPVSYESGKRPS